MNLKDIIETKHANPFIQSRIFLSLIFTYDQFNLQNKQINTLCNIKKGGNSISSGQFTLRDMYEQFQNIMKMGPFSQIMVCMQFEVFFFSIIVFCYGSNLHF